MAIKFIPSTGMVLMCNFDTGFVPPEMTKIRHVVIISPRYRRYNGTCLVVPFSTVAPNPVEPFHYRIPANKYTFFKKDTDIWVKGDLVSHIAVSRLDRVLCDGKYSSPSLNPDDLKCIQLAVWNALGRPEINVQATPQNGGRIIDVKATEVRIVTSTIDIPDSSK
jgi:mRNA interferase MazF